MAKKRKKLTKKQSERTHARTRALERLDVTYTRHERRRIIASIQKGNSKDAVFVRRDSHRVTLWRVKVDGVTAIAVYDSVRKEVVTFLTETMIDNVNHGQPRGNNPAASSTPSAPSTMLAPSATPTGCTYTDAARVARAARIAADVEFFQRIFLSGTWKQPKEGKF